MGIVRLLEVLGIKNAAGARINPSTEDKQDTLKTALDQSIGFQTDAEASGNGSLIAVAKRLRTVLTSVETNTADAETLLAQLIGEVDALEEAVGSTTDASAGDAGTGALLAYLRSARDRLVEIRTNTSDLETLLAQLIGEVDSVEVLIEALSKAEDAAHASGDKGIMALGVRKDTPVAIAGTDGDYQPAIYDKTGRQYARVVLDPPEEGDGRTDIGDLSLENQTADATLHSVTGGKTFHMTSLCVTAYNTDTGGPGRIVVRDGSGGSIKIPFVMSPAGIAASLSTVPLQGGNVAFPKPVKFTSAVFIDILAGTIRYSISCQGYEK